MSFGALDNLADPEPQLSQRDVIGRYAAMGCDGDDGVCHAPAPAQPSAG